MTASELLAAALRDLRIRAMLSQAELARRIGTSQAQISRAETGTDFVSRGMLDRWVEACKDKSVAADVNFVRSISFALRPALPGPRRLSNR